MKKQWLLLIFSLVFLLLLSACGGSPGADEEPVDEGADPLNETEVDEEENEIDETRVDLLNSDADLVGYVDLIQEETGVTVELDIADLEPGVYGVHFHVSSSCTPPDGDGAGEPILAPGTLPDITVEEDRTVETEFFVENATLQPGDANSLFADEGTAFVIHEEPGETITLPEGSENPAILACGTIYSGQ